MIEQTDIRNKKALLQRKSLYSQLQQQVASMEETISTQEGTIDSLERAVVQSGIKNKINEGAASIDKSVTQTQAQQKILQNSMKDTVEMAKKELALEKQKISVDNKKSKAVIFSDVYDEMNEEKV